MRLNGGIFYNDKGITASIRTMHMESEILAMRNENVSGFDKVGYQRREIIIPSFAEYLGANALSSTVDDKVGRINISDSPLDLALANKGYFQTQTSDGIKLTRDGRFKIGADGGLLTLEDAQVLSSAGIPIKFPFIPQDLKQVKIDKNGKISIYNPKTNKLETVSNLGVVDSNGILVTDPNVKQGYTEHSNVSLHEEFIKLMPVMAHFDANRQMFMLQNSNLQRAIQQLGSAS